jgi:Uncharacterized conserved protein
MQKPILTMSILENKFGVCRFDPSNLIPDWAQVGDFFSITRTSDELSVVCLQDNIPDDIQCEMDWRILKVEGPLDFSLTGILASISKILAQHKISIFAISTYDTDYILVREKNLDGAVLALRQENYIVIE